ncbi:ABC transporter ATP-binding protein [Bacillus timonensis]|uniref:ABC transporter ATP-binding protein n=1 Tax=Bacillus timonensis TaxID=1033734 RepID=A0A4S3PY85_9BACI|nr:ABC transporter ATP-binding protein [Bacillus timonensis]THE14871.1 ABC transporter ATP-binding protein [Bacillus timonensis]
METDSIIKLEQLTKRYEHQFAVQNLSLSISKGEIFGLLGPNGAGKTTTILMMLGLSSPSSGVVQVCGIDSTRNPIKVKQKVGYLPDDVDFYHHMTGLENLLYTASLNNINRKQAIARAEILLKRVNLMDAAHKKTGKYSRGMRQRLGLADVLMKDPEVIILDEPTLGIDPEGVRDFLHLIKELKEKDQKTILLSSHHLHQVQQICDRVGIFVDGKLLAHGNLEELIQQLLLEDTFVIKVIASSIHERVLNELKMLADVNKVEVLNENSLEIYCKKDMTASISRTIIHSGAFLYHISKKDFGLDEIYHRYFEGRDVHESR